AWCWADNAGLDFSAPLPPEPGRHFLNVQNMLRQLFRPLQCRLILLHDRLIRPHSLPRTPQELQRLARELRGHALYVRRDCPECLHLRRQLRRWNLPLELRDIRKSPVYQDDLLAGVGGPRTPCLRIEENGGVRWIARAHEITTHLETRYV